LDDLIFSKGDSNNHCISQAATKRAVEEVKPIIVFLLISLAVMLIVGGSLAYRHGRKNIEYYVLAQEQKGLLQAEIKEPTVIEQKLFAK
jgi:hypothetical protein